MTWTHQDTPTAVEGAANVLTISQTLAAGQAVGDLVICQYTGDNQGGANPGSIAVCRDNQSMPWTRRDQAWGYNGTALQGVGAFDCRVRSTTTSTVTVDYTPWGANGGDFVGIYCSRYRGAGPNWDFCEGRANTGNSAAPQLASAMSPTYDNCLLHSQITGSTSEVQPAGWTIRINNSGNANSTADLVQTSKTVSAVVWSMTSAQWAMNGLIYRDDLGAGAGPTANLVNESDPDQRLMAARKW